MNPTLHITVNQEDINSGVAGDCENCPIARAAIRAVAQQPDVLGTDTCAVEVLDDILFVRARSRRHEGRLPERAREFVEDFDSKEEVRPFEFDVELELV